MDRAYVQEVVRQLRWPGHLALALKAEDEQIEDEAVVLEDEGREWDRKRSYEPCL